jgi:hypothetical protein
MSVEQKQCSTWTCSCGAPRSAWRPYCTRCANARRGKYRSMGSEAKRRANARSYLNTYIKRGIVEKQPCSHCGATEAEAHHSDYSKPLEVTWLCRECHLKLHGVPCARRAKNTRVDTGCKPVEMYEFYRSLHARGVTMTDLAKRLNVSRSVLAKLVTLLKRRRGKTWDALLALLTDKERDLLKCAAASEEWNSRQQQKRPRWSRDVVETLRETYRRDVPYPLSA